MNIDSGSTNPNTEWSDSITRVEKIIRSDFMQQPEFKEAVKEISDQWLRYRALYMEGMRDPKIRQARDIISQEESVLKDIAEGQELLDNWPEENDQQEAAKERIREGLEQTRRDLEKIQDYIGQDPAFFARTRQLESEKKTLEGHHEALAKGLARQIMNYIVRDEGITTETLQARYIQTEESRKLEPRQWIEEPPKELAMLIEKTLADITGKAGDKIDMRNNPREFRLYPAPLRSPLGLQKILYDSIKTERFETARKEDDQRAGRVIDEVEADQIQSTENDVNLAQKIENAIQPFTPPFPEKLPDELTHLKTAEEWKQHCVDTWKALEKSDIEKSTEANPVNPKPFIRLLERAIFTTQYEDETTKPIFIKRMQTVLMAAMFDNEGDFRRGLYAISVEGLGACEDRVAKGLKKLQRRARDEAAKDIENPAELSDLDREDFIEDTFEHLGSLQSVEKDKKNELTQFTLWYETQCGPDVGLTTATGKMKFTSYAGLTTQDKDFATNLIGLLEQGEKDEALTKIAPLHKKVTKIEVAQWRAKQEARGKDVDLPPPITREPLVSLSEHMATRSHRWIQYLEHNFKGKIDSDEKQEEKRIAEWEENLKQRSEKLSAPISTKGRPTMPTPAMFPGDTQRLKDAISEYQQKAKEWQQKQDQTEAEETPESLALEEERKQLVVAKDSIRETVRQKITEEYLLTKPLIASYAQNKDIEARDVPYEPLGLPKRQVTPALEYEVVQTDAEPRSTSSMSSRILLAIKGEEPKTTSIDTKTFNVMQGRPENAIPNLSEKICLNWKGGKLVSIRSAIPLVSESISAKNPAFSLATQVENREPETVFEGLKTLFLNIPETANAAKTDYLQIMNDPEKRAELAKVLIEKIPKPVLTIALYAKTVSDRLTNLMPETALKIASAIAARSSNIAQPVAAAAAQLAIKSAQQIPDVVPATVMKAADSIQPSLSKAVEAVSAIAPQKAIDIGTRAYEVIAQLTDVVNTATRKGTFIGTAKQIEDLGWSEADTTNMMALHGKIAGAAAEHKKDYPGFPMGIGNNGAFYFCVDYSGKSKSLTEALQNQSNKVMRVPDNWHMELVDDNHKPLKDQNWQPGQKTRIKVYDPQKLQIAQGKTATHPR